MTSAQSENSSSTNLQLEEKGWRQGSLVRSQDIPNLYSEYDGATVLIVASQSCDIAQENLELEPFVELSIGKVINSLSGNFSYGKNPRKLHLEIRINTEELFATQCVELIASKKIQVNKADLASFYPETESIILDHQLNVYVHWLAARYSRPALPTTFNNLISSCDPKDKQRKLAKSHSPYLSGIYVEINPDAEIADDEKYQVNLLGLTSVDISDTQLEEAKKSLNEYASIIKNAGMDVVAITQKEDEVSFALMKRFKRFYFDDLSLKEGHALPIESNL